MGYRRRWSKAKWQGGIWAAGSGVIGPGPAFGPQTCFTTWAHAGAQHSTAQHVGSANSSHIYLRAAPYVTRLGPRPAALSPLPASCHPCRLSSVRVRRCPIGRHGSRTTQRCTTDALPLHAFWLIVLLQPTTDELSDWLQAFWRQLQFFWIFFAGGFFKIG